VYWRQNLRKRALYLPSHACGLRYCRLLPCRTNVCEWKLRPAAPGLSPVASRGFVRTAARLSSLHPLRLEL
jgi:hypothetical protein